MIPFQRIIGLVSNNTVIGRDHTHRVTGPNWIYLMSYTQMA